MMAKLHYKIIYYDCSKKKKSKTKILFKEYIWKITTYILIILKIPVDTSASLDPPHPTSLVGCAIVYPVRIYVN